MLIIISSKPSTWISPNDTDSTHVHVISWSWVRVSYLCWFYVIWISEISLRQDWVILTTISFTWRPYKLTLCTCTIYKVKGAQRIIITHLWWETFQYLDYPRSKISILHTELESLMPPVTVGVGYLSQCAVMILDHDDLNCESNTDKNMNDITHSFIIFP